VSVDEVSVLLAFHGVRAHTQQAVLALWVQSAGGYESAARGLVRHLHADADAGLQVVCRQGGDADAEVDVPAAHAARE
jgi:hypothetical protein